MRFLHLIVVFFAVLIAYVQKLVALCRSLITGLNDCVPPSPFPVRALLMFSLSRPSRLVAHTKMSALPQRERQILKGIGCGRMPGSELKGTNQNTLNDPVGTSDQERWQRERLCTTRVSRKFFLDSTCAGRKVMWKVWQTWVNSFGSVVKYGGMTC